MAKKSVAPPPHAAAVTADRAARLYRLLVLLSKGPQSRAGITRRLKLGIRGFYRDLDALRAVGILVDLVGGKYALTENSHKVVDRLPFPDPGLTLGEAQQLAKGRSPAHNKLRKQIKQIVG